MRFKTSAETLTPRSKSFLENRCYFNEFLFSPFKNSEFVNHELLSRYLYVGGVRIEDKYVHFSLPPSVWLEPVKEKKKKRNDPREKR